MSIGAITYTEILHWATLMQLQVLPQEVEAIRAVDKAYVAHSHSKNSKKESPT